MATFCPDCNEPTNHTIEYLGALLDTAILPIVTLPGRVFTSSYTNHGSSMVRLYTWLERLSMGHFLNTYDDHTLLLDQVLWDEAKRRGITMREFRLFGAAKGIFIATLPHGKVLEFDGVPLPPWRAAWYINNKPKLVAMLHKQSFPTAKGTSVRTLAQAQKLFATLSTPLIVKPSIGSASRHTTMHIQTKEKLAAAFVLAKKLSPFVMIEEELSGQVHRPTLVNGKLIAVLRRDQPCVWGDGVHTVQGLVEDENKNPARQGPYFSRIKLDDAATAELAQAGLTVESIPAQGVRVQLHPKINWGLGGTTTDVTDEVHPDNKKLFEDVATFLHAPLVGIDFIIEDIAKSWKDQKRCGIIECNDMPYFDNHHLPYRGQARDVAGPIWDLVTA
jgi:D-alanine-D-alanine ligase-like ATP-grasp enzyme